MATKKHVVSAAQRAQKGSKKKRRRAEAKHSEGHFKQRMAASERRDLYGTPGLAVGLAELALTVGGAKRRKTAEELLDEMSFDEVQALIDEEHQACCGHQH